MWPSALDMTRDECRGVLRRLELETYSNVVSTFRAQGGLSEVKVKILEELRNVLHISQDRHRAEARRVANDEQLSTIAETISGPNTTQEWSREGRRPFPLLPRSAPYTALSAVANGVAEVVKNDNAKLPFPSDTRRLLKSKMDENVHDSKTVVRQDPSVSSSEGKKTLKRPHSIVEHMLLTTHPVKKRSVGGEHVQLQANQSHLHTNTRIQQLYHNHSKTQSRHKKSAPKRNTSNVRSRSSSNIQKATHSQKNIKVDNQMSNNKSNIMMARNLHTYASVSQQKVQSENVSTTDNSNRIIESETVPPAASWPQIATSKKDITNNLSKLNMIGASGLPASSGISGEANKFLPLPVQNINLEGRNLANNLVNPSPVSWSQKVQTVVTPNVRTNSTSSNTKPLNKPLSKLNSPSAIPIANNSLSHKSNKDEGLTTKLIPDKDDTESNHINVFPNCTQVSQDNLPNTEGDLRKGVALPSNSNLEAKPNLNTSIAFIPGNKQKIQILGQQTISPAGSLKLPVGMQLKGIPGRKSVKIFSSPSGKMFIQSGDNPKNLAQLGAVVAQKNIIGGLTLSGSTPSAPTVANTGRIQKIQLLTGGSAGKPMNFNKSDMILMQGNVVSTPASGNILLRSIPLVKPTKKLQLQGSGKPVNEIGCSNMVKNQNVIVIGAVSSEKPDRILLNKDMSTEKSMITEDTPVDILPSPIANLENSLYIQQVCKESQKLGKSTSITMLPSLSSVNSEEYKRKYQVRTDSSCLTSNEIHGIRNSQNQVTEENMENVTESGNYIISTTDWEVELDQEANKTRTETETDMRVEQDDAMISEDDCQKDLNMSSTIIDNFHDVIEEETIDDDSVINDNVTEGEEEMEFDVSYGSIQEDIDENESIEYVEETGTSSDVLVEVYGESVKVDSDCNMKNRRTKLIPATRTHSLIYSTTESRFEECVQEARTSSLNDMHERKIVTCMESPSNGRTQSAIMFQVDELNLDEMRGVTFDDFLSSGRKEKVLNSVSNVKRISD